MLMDCDRVPARGEEQSMALNLIMSSLRAPGYMGEEIEKLLEAQV